MKNLIIKLLQLSLSPKKKNLPSPGELLNQFGSSPKILIVRQHNQLGDMLLSNSLFRALKEKIFDCHITLIASEENYIAVTSNKFIDRLIVLEKKKFWNPIHLIRFFVDLRKQNFTLAIVPVTVSISFSSCLIARLIGAKYTIGPSSLNNKINKYAFLFDYKIDINNNPEERRHISDVIQDIIRPFGVFTLDLSEHILIQEKDQMFAENFFKNSNDLKVGLHIGAGKIPNRWNIQNFAYIINYLKNKLNAFVYLTIGHWDEELLKEISKYLNFSPKVLRNLPIPKLAAVIDKSDLFISNDTGIMHVAGSTRTPLIALFGPTDPEIWAPVGENKFYIKKGDDINLIQVDDVIQLINKIFEEKINYVSQKNSCN